MLKFFAIIGCLLIGNTFAATTQPPLIEGKDYTILTVAVQKTPETKGKINVKEFFSYACIHCKEVESSVEKSIAQDKSIDLNKIQVVWGDQAEINGFAKLNATIQALGLQKLNTPAFTAIFSNQNLNDPEKLKAFLGQNGLKPADVDNFIATYNSFAIAGKVGEYKNLTKAYNINGTPTFIIADKYIASPALPERLVSVVQALVVLARQDKTNNPINNAKPKKANVKK